MYSSPCQGIVQMEALSFGMHVRDDLTLTGIRRLRKVDREEKLTGRWRKGIGKMVRQFNDWTLYLPTNLLSR